MKKLLLFLVIGTLIYGCSGSSDEGTSVEMPIANAEHDNSNYGIYKGVFSGSTGALLIDIKNDDNSVTALLSVDGVNSTYTTSSVITQNQEVQIKFTNGSNEFDFSVDANGGNPTISNIIIAGHPNASMAAAKETSTSLVSCYLGKYLNEDFGTFNVISKYGKVPFMNSQRDEWIFTGVGRSEKYNQNFTVLGLSNWENKITGTYSVGSQTAGTFTGVRGDNLIKGDWENSTTNATGTWSGTKHNF